MLQRDLNSKRSTSLRNVYVAKIGDGVAPNPMELMRSVGFQ